MRNTKKLILSISILSCLITADQQAFRGKTTNQLIGQSIPLSFVNLVSENYNILPSQINPQRGSYLIISPDGVASYLNNFMEFKRSQGFDVYLLPLSEAGETATAIKNTISNFLENDPMLEYVLLIGDVDGFAECPSFYYGPENDVTDQQFTHILGDDIVPDVFIGRLSIDSLSDLFVILSKTVQYARNPLAYDEGWLDRGLIVAGNYANTYPIPITPKWTSYWLMDELEDYGYSQVDTVFYPPTQQGSPYIVPIIDNGVGIVNYRGWGDANGWHYPEFHVENVNELNNGWLTPVFMSYVCNSNDFANNVDPCLAEAVIRGGTPTVPKGGVAFIGPSDLHTSTKYNNVINAYMYDAMLNHDVVELGPAMQAGQWGLTKEFPSQDGTEEAQEFYANVYNILGDPSLQMYLDTPKQFNISVNTISNVDDYAHITVGDLTGELIQYAVISIMSDGEILAKGITDEHGEFVSSLHITDISSLDIYANKGGFIQGHEIVSISDANDQGVALSNITVNGESDGVKPVLGTPFSFDIELENISNNTIPSSSATLSFSSNASPSTIDINVPSIGVGQTVMISDIEVTSFGADVSNYLTAYLAYNGDMNVEFNFAIELEIPVFAIEFLDQPEPGSEFVPEFMITNFSGGNYEGVAIELSPLSEGASVINQDNGSYLNLPSFGSSNYLTNYSILLDSVSYGSDVTFLVEFVKSGQTFHSEEVSLHIIPLNTFYPVPPSEYGYWAYDNTDIDYEQKPTFNWIELDPNFGGDGATHHQLDDDDHVDIDLPFTFQYHGIDYNQITINSNGWTSFEGCELDYFWNMSIPMYMGPKAMLAPFSDDLETIDSDDDGDIDIWINVYTRYDQDHGRFIIEWSRALNGYDEVTEETFEVILYNQSSMPTASGDGVIEFQYLEIEDVDVTKNYSTIGIESPNKDQGIQYVFNNVYSDGAAVLENELAIRFTTESPANYVAPLDVEPELSPNTFLLEPAYPNPFNPVTNFNFMIPFTEKVSLNIYDILGRNLINLHNGILVSGQYRFSWDGQDKRGHVMSTGTYFLVVEYGESKHVQKLLLLK